MEKPHSRPCGPIAAKLANSAGRSLTAASNLLVILDNALDAGQVRPLIPAGADCRALVISRDALSTLDRARHLHPAGLGNRDAVTLLARIAGGTARPCTSWAGPPRCAGSGGTASRLCWRRAS
ncbi:hypothetical protein AB0I81_17530 [Nonomuraea sp. NPDC050404]|uniref:hypothetical protein n=1 Tax=Nonomuraea sp. NPDC050404 TaxID=3155783 RepID=UPI0033E2A1B7